MRATIHTKYFYPTPYKKDMIFRNDKLWYAAEILYYFFSILTILNENTKLKSCLIKM